MLRPLWRSFAAASLLFVLALVAIWLRSYWRADAFTFTSYGIVPASTPDPYIQDDENYGSFESAEVRELRKEQEAQYYTRRRYNCDYEIRFASGSAYISWTFRALSFYPLAPQVDWNWYVWTQTSSIVNYNPSLAGKSWGYSKVDYPFSNSGSGGGQDAGTQRGLLFPIWFPAALLAVLPACWLRGVCGRQVAARHRRRDGKCPQCGYDLRATPQRCPECGRPATAPVRPALSDESQRGPGIGCELLTLGLGTVLLLVAVGACVLPFSTRLATMKNLYAKDMQLKAAAEAATIALDTNDARGLRAAFAAGAIYGPKEISARLANLVDRAECVDVACVLVDHCPDVSHLPGEILCQAVMFNPVLARTLVAKGANVNAPGEKDGRTPLACCLAYGDNDEVIEFFELLLEKGADPNGRHDSTSWTILHRLAHESAIHPHRVRLAEMVIEKGADVNATADITEATPLLYSSEDETDPFVQLLLSKGGKRHEKAIDPH